VESLKKQREKYEKELEALRHDLERAEGAKSKCLYETEKVQVDMEKVGLMDEITIKTPNHKCRLFLKIDL
jgi:hypothetical protein